jgi:deferrochelatase/peroxidase EfeB
VLGLTGGVAAAEPVRELARRSRERGRDQPVVLGIGAAALAGAAPGRHPRGLRPMTPFPGDLLEPRRTDAALVLQVEGDTPEQAEEGLRGMLDGVSAVEVTWAVSGHRPENGMHDGRALTRNPFGFTEGFANPHDRERKRLDDVALVPAGAGEPPWAVGGSYLALRVIRLARELWDADPVDHQERLVGRRRDGTWLDGSPAAAEPAFARDPDGQVTPLDSHVRRANPRTPGVASPRLLRRSWAYQEEQPGTAAEDGLLFMCYQADLETGFLPVQRRLVGQAMDRYLLTVGGGYFLVPAAHSSGQPWEDALFA